MTLMELVAVNLLMALLVLCLTLPSIAGDCGVATVGGCSDP